MALIANVYPKEGPYLNALLKYMLNSTITFSLFLVTALHDSLKSLCSKLLFFFPSLKLFSLEISHLTSLYLKVILTSTSAPGIPPFCQILSILPLWSLSSAFLLCQNVEFSPPSSSAWTTAVLSSFPLLPSPVRLLHYSQTTTCKTKTDHAGPPWWSSG